MAGVTPAGEKFLETYLASDTRPEIDAFLRALFAITPRRVRRRAVIEVPASDTQR